MINFMLIITLLLFHQVNIGKFGKKAYTLSYNNNSTRGVGKTAPP